VVSGSLPDRKWWLCSTALIRPLTRSTTPFVRVDAGGVGRGRAVFDAQPGAEPAERVRARGRAPAQAEQAVGERLAEPHPVLWTSGCTLRRG
jgi:hypothetical protein